MFQQAGYATGGVGKWALGDADTAGAPWRKGMDEFFGYLDQTHAHTYYPDFLWRDGQRLEIASNQQGKRTVYSHDLFADQALDFIRRHQDQPFFFYGAGLFAHASQSAIGAGPSAVRHHPTHSGAPATIRQARRSGRAIANASGSGDVCRAIASR